MFDPPSQPAAGWYPDPHRPGTNRWWNGRDWDAAWDDGFQVGGAGPGDLPEIGEWLTRSISLGLSRWRAAVTIGLATGAAGTVLFSVAARHLLADVVITDDDVIGWSNDRLPLGVALAAIGMLLGFVGQLAITVLMLRTVDGETPATASQEFRHGWSAVLRSIRILPRTLGWTMLLLLAALMIVLVTAGVMVVVLPLGIILLLALMPAAIYIAIRLAFVTQSIVDRPGQPFTRSFEVSRDRFWAVVGRLLLFGLLMWLVSVVIQLGSSLAGGNFGSGWGSGIEIDGDGSLTRYDLADAFPTSIASITVGALVAVATTVLVTGVAGAAMAILYRTRNPAGEAFVAATRRKP